MFGKMKGMMEQMAVMQRMMKDENFRAFISHPKVQEVFQDPEFKEVAKTQDATRIFAHPKFAALLRDPEVGALMSKIDPKQFLGGK